MCEFLINKENISNMLINISVTGQLLSVQQVHLAVKPERFYGILFWWSKILHLRTHVQILVIPRIYLRMSGKAGEGTRGEHIFSLEK